MRLRSASRPATGDERPATDPTRPHDVRCHGNDDRQRDDLAGDDWFDDDEAPDFEPGDPWSDPDLLDDDEPQPDEGDFWLEPPDDD